MWWWFATALAAPVSVDASGPVSVKVDGVFVARMVTSTTAELPPGRHRIEVCDALGNVVGWSDVEVAEAPIALRYADRRVTVLHAEDGAPEGDRTPMSEADFGALARSLAGGKAKHLEALPEAVAGRWLTMKQVGTLLVSFDDLNDRLIVARIAAPRTVDPQNVGAILRLFATASAKDEVKALFAS